MADDAAKAVAEDLKARGMCGTIFVDDWGTEVICIRPQPCEIHAEPEDVVAAWEALNAQRAENPTALVAFLCEAGDALAAEVKRRREFDKERVAEMGALAARVRELEAERENEWGWAGAQRKFLADKAKVTGREGAARAMEGYAFEDDDSFCGEDRTHQRPWIFVPFCEHENAVDGDGNEKRAILVFPEGDALAAAYQAECEKNATLAAELKRSGLGVGADAFPKQIEDLDFPEETSE